MANRPNAGRGHRGERAVPSPIADEHTRERVEALVSNSPLAVIEWDREHRVVQWAGNAPHIFGWSASEVVGKRVDEWRFVYEGDWEQVHAAMDAMERGRNFVSRNRNYRKDGSLIHCEWYNSVLLAHGAYRGGLSLVLDITERARMQEALRVFEKKYQDIVETAPMATFRSTIEGRFLSANSKLAGMLGYDSPAEITEAIDNIGEQLFLHPEERSAIVERALSSDGFVVAEVEYRRRDGSVCVVHLHIRAVRDPAGLPTCLEGFGEDITERKRAEERLRADERRLVSIYNTVEDAIFHLAVEPPGQFRFVSVNAAFLRITGLRLETVIGKTVHEIIPEPSLTMVLGKYRQAVEENTIVHWEETSDYPTGRLTGEVSVAPVFNDKGICTHLVGSVHDITERKIAEERLNASEERFRSAFERSAVPMALTGPDARFLKVNPALCRMLGYDDAALVGHSVYEFTHPDDLELNRRVVQEFLDSGASFRIQKRYLARDGRVIWGDISSAAVRDSEGRPSYMVTHIQDITERKQAEQALQDAYDAMERRVQERTAELSAANERLMELDRLKSQFLASMSHELRTPLNSIVGFTSLLSRGLSGPVTAEQKKQLEIVQASAKHLLTLINDLLDVSRIEAGKADLERRAFDFVDVLNEAIASLTPMAGRKGLELKTETSAPAIPMIGDRKRTLQILLNLVNNAIKFTEKGYVKVTTAVEEGRLRVAVADTGIGIKPEHLGMLFEAFRQVDGSAKRIYEGTGLGLYLCRKLLGLMGGEIHVESEYGVGSCFTYAMPLELAVEGVACP